MPRLTKQTRFNLIIGGKSITRIAKYNAAGGIRLEKTKQNGKLHSTTAPAYIVYDDDGSKLIEKWYWNGKIHRDGGQPAVIIHDATYNTRYWYELGKLHRHKGAAVVRVKPSGTVVHEFWKRGTATWPYRKVFRHGATDFGVLLGTDPVGDFDIISEGYKYGKKCFWFQRGNN
jgi:hypothetical protein